MQLEARACSSYQASEAVVIYRNSAQHGYATCHPLSLSGGELHYGAGRPLQKSDLLGLLSALQGRALQWVDSTTLLCGVTSRVWHRPAGLATLRFETSDPSLNDLSGFAFGIPALIFACDGHSLQVWAHREETRPVRETALFRAPFFNTDSGGRVCWGNARRPGSLEQASWEAAFFESYFTHGSGNRCHQYSGSYSELWTQARASGVFPAEALVPMNLRLGDAILGGGER